MTTNKTQTSIVEIMFSSSIYDNEARNYSFTCLREIFN